MEETINDGTCFDIHMVVEEEAPDWTVPKKAVEHEDRNKICLACNNHVYD